MGSSFLLCFAAQPARFPLPALFFDAKVLNPSLQGKTDLEKRQ
jgi:hypothetical protein